MKWEDWSLKKKIFLGSIGFIVLYILTIPIRDYGSFGIDGPSLLNHLAFIVVGVVVYTILISIISVVIDKIKS